MRREPESWSPGRHIRVEDRRGSPLFAPRALTVIFQEAMRFARQPDDGALLAAQHDPAARDGQGSRDIIFAAGQYDGARGAVQRGLNAAVYRRALA